MLAGTATALSTLGAAGLAVPGRASAQDAGTAAGLPPLYRKSSLQARSPDAGRAALSSAPSDAVRALRRLTFGYRPEDLVEFESTAGDFDAKLAAWVDNQLTGYTPSYPPANDPPLQAVIGDPATNFETLDDSLTTLWAERVVADPGWPYYAYPLYETQYLAIIRAVYSQWQLAEVLADFWHTHFSVQGDKFEVSPVFVHYDRDVIRPNMLGRFRTMLEEVTKSTAMMYYLDNVYNSKFGPNENFARELQELHTLGAVNSYGFTPEGSIPPATPLAGSSVSLPAGLKAGYSEADVLQVTLCLTGWTVSLDYTDSLNTGEFVYHAPWHDTSSKRVLGIDLTSSGQDEVSDVLDLLAMHPETARYVCTKLCRRLIGDDPPASIVEAAATVFNDQWEQSDQLDQVVRTIILSDEFKDSSTWGQKTKRPFELIAGAMRSCGGPAHKIVRPTPIGDWEANLQLGIDYAFSQGLAAGFSQSGHMPFTWITPDGFPDVQQAWLGSTPLIMGWSVINGLFMSYYPDDPFDLENTDWSEFYPVDVVAATKTAFPDPNDRTANKIVDYWVNRILGYDAAVPAGPQLDTAIRSELIAFIQQDAASADTALDLDADGWSASPWSAYVPQRLQTLIAGIVMLPENQLR